MSTPDELAFASTLEAAKAGAEWAWSELFREHAGPVTGYLGARGAAEPEDLASEVFLKVARAIHRFDGDRASFRSWVFVIAHRTLIDERRSRGRRPGLVELDEQNPGGNVEQEAMERLVTEEWRRAFEHLTDDQRDVLALRMIGGLTLADTADVLDKRVGAVKALQRRALASLMRNLREEGVTP